MSQSHFTIHKGFPLNFNRTGLNEKKEIENKLAAFARQGAKRFEPLRRFYELCLAVGEAADSGNPADNLQIMRKIGSNFLLGGKKIKLKFSFPTGKLREFNALAATACAKSLRREIWRGRRDSNPRSSP